MQRLQTEQWVPFPVANVFRFFANPGNLPRIMPPQQHTELIRLDLVPPPGISAGRATVTSEDPIAGAGSKIGVSFRVVPFLPLRVRWMAEIMEFEMDRSFVDVQVRGPFQHWRHRHEFEPAAREGREGTMVRDAVEYDVGWGFLGAWAERLFVGPQMKRTFAHRQQVLEKLLANARS